MNTPVRAPRILPNLAMVVGLALGCGSEVETGTGGGGGSAADSTSSSGSLSTGSSAGGGGPGAGGSTGAGTNPSYAACSVAGSCVLAANTCCGVCGVPTLADVDPIQVDQAEAHRAAVCPDPSVACPACEAQENPNLYAYCELGSGTCMEADLATSAYAECSGPDDCRLRLSLECCECGASGDWVAVTAVREQDLEALLCPPEPNCAKCQPVPPVDLAAGCVDGFCAVVPAQ